ncbi:7455_t:CDS:1, partial [Dentiscutata heterogama]
ERVFYEHHQLNQEARCTAMKMLKAEAKPSIIYETIRDEDGKLITTRKDISNLGLKLTY